MASKGPANIRGDIVLQVVKGKNLDDVQTFGKQDPYVRVAIDDSDSGEKWFKTPTHEDGGTSPEWNYKGPERTFDGSESLLDIQVKNDSVGSDELIGWVHVPLGEIAELAEDEEGKWFAIQRGGKKRGTILLKAKYTPAS